MQDNPIINPTVEQARFLEIADRQAALRDYESALARVRVAMNVHRGACRQ
ncbi:MAG: hypothetical protein IPK27_14420 [Rhodanobacteraceae bacterium]|nr:hypothetical protein [Rhodanobacteraceae bacterium]